MPRAHPAFSQEVADEICARLAEGQSLNKACSDPEMPAESTVRAWVLDDHEGFAAKYARARELGYMKRADEIYDIANTPLIGTKTVEKASGIETTTADMIEHRRLQIDARKWELSKMLPKVYGDKVAVGGAEDLPAIKTEPVSETDLARRVAFVLAQGLKAAEK